MESSVNGNNSELAEFARNVWTWLGENHKQIGVVLALGALILTVASFVFGGESQGPNTGSTTPLRPEDATNLESASQTTSTASSTTTVASTTTDAVSGPASTAEVSSTTAEGSGITTSASTTTKGTTSTNEISTTTTTAATTTTSTTTPTTAAPQTVFLVDREVVARNSSFRDFFEGVYSVNGEEYTHSVGMDSGTGCNGCEARITYQLSREFTEFRATVGLRDGSRPLHDHPFLLVFEVYGDGQLLGSVSLTLAEDHEFILDVTGVFRLDLAVQDLDNGEVGVFGSPTLHR